MRGREALDPGLGASAGLSEVVQWPCLDRPEPRLQAAWHHNIVCGARSRHRKDHRGSFKTPSPRRVSRLHEQRHRGLSGPKASRHPRQPQHPQEKRALAQGPPQRAISFHADKRVLAQSGRGLVLDLAGQSLSGSSFTSLKQLQEHIDAYVNAYNDKAEPFVWTKKKVRQRPFKGRRITQL